MLRLVPMICPKCGHEYTDRPAISRTDNKTCICPDCGIREALESIGVDEEEREKILVIIHRYYDKIGRKPR